MSVTPIKDGRQILLQFKNSNSWAFPTTRFFVREEKISKKKGSERLNINIEDPLYALKVYPYRYGGKMCVCGNLLPRGEICTHFINEILKKK